MQYTVYKTLGWAKQRMLMFIDKFIRIVFAKRMRVVECLCKFSSEAEQVLSVFLFFGKSNLIV